MKALVLEEKNVLNIREISINEPLGVQDLRIKIVACGICGSDIHYYKEGRIGDFVIESPMILGHEASGIVIEVGARVDRLKVGDRVCMEPGIPNFRSKETLEGNYNLDMDMVFWATPPVHGVMRESVVHPESFTFRLPENVSFHEGALVEPLAIGIESAKNAKICPGDVALVTGCGPIGILIALSALAGGCSKIIISDIVDEKLKIAESYPGIIGVNISKENLRDKVLEETNGYGVDILFEASGSPTVYPDVFKFCRRGGKAVLVGMTNELAKINISQLQVLGLSIHTVFRYRNCFERALEIIASEKIDFKKLITRCFSFDESLKAYRFATQGNPKTVKIMIDF